jgi:hypothetical protein
MVKYRGKNKKEQSENVLLVEKGKSIQYHSLK